MGFKSASITLPGLHYNSEQSRDAFRKDLQAIVLNRVERFPTVTMSFMGKTIVLTGYQTYNALVDALMHINSADFRGSVLH